MNVRELVHAWQSEVPDALVALGLGEDEARRVLRLSFGRDNTLADVERTQAAFAACAMLWEVLSSISTSGRIFAASPLVSVSRSLACFAS